MANILMDSHLKLPFDDVTNESRKHLSNDAHIARNRKGPNELKGTNCTYLYSNTKMFHREVNSYKSINFHIDKLLIDLRQLHFVDVSDLTEYEPESFCKAQFVQMNQQVIFVTNISPQRQLGRYCYKNVFFRHLWIYKLLCFRARSDYAVVLPRPVTDSFCKKWKLFAVTHACSTVFLQ